MKWLASGSMVLLLFVASAQAQSPAKQAPSPRPAPAPSPGIHVSAGELTATPGMWFYEQALRQYNNPKWVIRQKAEYRASERLRRIEAMKWYGLSNARPTAGVDPVHDDSSSWTSGNVYQPFRWSAAGTTTVIIAAGKSSRQ
jgi:hypothetical protein